MFEVIILDLHGILVNKFPTAEYQRKVRQLLRNNNFNNKYEYENWKNQYGTMTRAMEEHNLKKEYFKVLNSISVIKHEDKELISLIKEARKYFTLYIATNTTKRNALKTMKAAKIPTNLFKGIITAENVQKGKPEPSMYKKILKREVKMPNKFIAIGDRMTDIIPAGKLGMRGFLCDYETFKVFLNAIVKVCGEDTVV